MNFPLILFELFQDWAMFAVWQSFMILGLAVALERFLRHSPWLAHLLLTFAICGAVLTPTISLMIHRCGGGVVEPGSIFALEKQTQGVCTICGFSILIGGPLFFLFSLYSIVLARRLMFLAKPFPDRELQEALLEGSRMMRNISLPVLFTSPSIKSPTVWSWGLHPAVLLPESLSQTLSPQERNGIFLHELAHIARRDHWAALLTRLCCVVLFWNPLYWLALKLSDLAADRSCDLLVLSKENISSEIYGDTLFRLAAGEKNLPILQYLSRKELLMKRIDTILDFEENQNRYSVARTTLKAIPLTVCILILATLCAFCQEKTDSKPHQSENGYSTPNGFTHLIVFGPKGDFNPRTPRELLRVINEPLFRMEVIITGYFRTKPIDGKLIGSICTNDPDGLKNIIETTESLEFIEAKRLTAKMFEEHEKTFQESLPNPRFLEIEKADWFKNLNELQKKYTAWDENQFVADYDLAIPDDENERKSLEKKWIELLEGDEPVRYRYNGNTDDFTRAIVGLAKLKSLKAKELLTKIACQRVFKDNAYRHTATKMLGMLGDPAAVPELIPLIYHFNFNTRVDAQISLVRLTGQNFAYDSQAWGKWYNENREKLGKNLPEFDLTPVDWTFGLDNTEIRFYSDPKNQKEMDETWLRRQGGEMKNAPKITKMEPENGAKDVDADKVTEIRVTFDRDMNTNGYSWCGGPPSFPETTDKPRWIDKRTCVLPVKLVADKKYELSINAASFTGFKSAEGVPVEPVLYLFSTTETAEK